MNLRELINRPLSILLPNANSANFANSRQESDKKTKKLAELAISEPPLNVFDKSILLTWLASIGETNTEAIYKLIQKCEKDISAREYFLGLAIANIDKTANINIDDDRRYCHQCANLSPTGQCLAAWQGEIKATRSYRPMDDLPLRCGGYQPKADDPDQRQPYERWPKLFNRK
jgi:hypothetical protein